jgi:hypothetical protein
MPETEVKTPNPNYFLVSASGKFGASPLSAATEVGRILDSAIEKNPENGLVLHFHGGLITRTYALESIVAPLTKTYLDAKAYPLFFVWESGFAESLVNNKGELGQDPAFRELVKKVSEWVLRLVSLTGTITFKGSGGQDIDDIYKMRQEYDAWFDGKAPSPPVPDDYLPPGPSGPTMKASTVTVDRLAEDIEDEINDDPGFKRAMAEAYNATLTDVEVHTKGAGTGKKANILLLSPDALDELFSTGQTSSTPGAVDPLAREKGIFAWAAVAKFTAKIIISVIKRFRAGSDHGVYCTVVEEVLRSAYGNLVGAGIWNQMKKDTLDSFEKGPDFCGTAVVDKLKALEETGSTFSKITLVGHSTGAIYVCNFLDAVKTAGLKTPIRVVFLAPAVTYQRFAEAVQVHENEGLSNFRMFAMHDDRESMDRMLSILYTRSLLYFVSGLLEGETDGEKFSNIIDMPLVGMERYLIGASFQENPAVKSVQAFLTEQPNRTVWSYSMGQSAGFNSDSRRHGDFDNDLPTLESVAAFIAA